MPFTVHEVVRNLRIRQTLIAAVVVALGLGSGVARAQLIETKIWDVARGTHVSDLPSEFVRQACGTNGGPPSLPLDGFEEFERCAVEVETGLREVWFSYDDEMELVYRAFRAPEEQMGQARANVLFMHPVLFSLLIDDQGLMKGYRVVSDSREDPSTRMDADVVARPLKLTVYGTGGGWECIDLPREAGEEPIGDVFFKELCKKITDDGWHVSIETHLYLKRRRSGGVQVARGTNEFAASVRLEVISADLVANLPAGG